jgi:hypothetical protein
MCPVEHETFQGQPVKVRGANLAVAAEADGVGAQRIDGDEQDIERSASRGL